MVHRENLFDGDIVAGIITALIVMILFSIYAIISPTSATTLRRVFQPYPTISPKDIPDAPVGNQKCFEEKTSCDAAGPANQCAKLCGKLDNSFSCTQPGGPLTPAGRIPTFYNGMKLNPENHYCLPKAETSFNNEDASSTINPNTGVWEWVTDSDYCATVGDQAVGNQCWKPRCLYPSLFANEDGGCNDFIGCRPSEGGPVQSSLKLTLAGATELFPSSPENAVGLLFDPIRTWSSTTGSTRGIGDDVIKYNSTGEPIITKNVILQANYQALISEGPHKTTSNGEPYWACACNDRFSTDADDAQGVCSMQQNVPWGICESQADQKSCEENIACTFHHPTRIFRPPDDSKSCQTDFCASKSENYLSNFIPHIRTPNLFSVSPQPSPGAPEFPYCVCPGDGPDSVEACQTGYNATQTIIPYGRRKGLMGRNPCINRMNEDENKIYLIKSKGGVVASMSDFSSPDNDYDIQCCQKNFQPGTTLDDNKCDPESSGLFYRYCLSRNHTGNPGPGGVCLTGTKQQDSCIIIDTNGQGYCASTLGNGGHVIKGKSKQCNSKKPCADVCYTEITSGKVYDPKTKQNSRWKNAHNCDLGTSNDLGIESVFPCEANHCQANCYKEGEYRCVNIYSGNSSASPAATDCTTNTTQTDCDKHPDDCRYIRNFATACNKLEDTKYCTVDQKEGYFCAINDTPRSGTCMNRTENGKTVLKCVNCSCEETLVTSPVCAGIDASGETPCQNDNDCAGSPMGTETVPGFGPETYDVQDKFCDMMTLDSNGKGVCKTWGTCTVNLDVNSGYKAPGPGGGTQSICLKGNKPGDKCTTTDDCRPCHFCANGTCVNPADPNLADCDTLSGPACSKENNCKLREDGTCVYLVEPDPNMVCIQDSADGYRCNTNRALALYPKTSWMDQNAPRGSTYTRITGGTNDRPRTIEHLDNRIKPSSVKGNDKFRCRNDQGCLGFAPQKNASELPKSVELTYTNHPKAALITPYGGNGAWLSSGGSTAADGPLAPKVCNTDDDCSGGGSCRLLNPGQPEQGICISPNFSGWDGDPGSTYMEPSFWDGTGGNNWALQLTTCGSKDDNCPPDLSWCSKGGLDGYPNVRKFGCSLTGGLLGDYQCTNGIMTSPDGDTVVDPSVIIKDPLTGKMIKNDKEAAAACVTYYSEKCFPGIKMDANEQPIPQVLSFKPTRDGSKGLMNVTPCLVDGTLIGATVGSDPFWNDQIGFDKTWGRDPSGKSTGADVNSLFIANEVPCCSNNNNETNQRNFQEGSQGGCVGGSTVLETKRGRVKVLDLHVGDFIKTRKGWSKVFYIRNHGFFEIHHLKFMFEDGAEITITDDHLVFDTTNNLKRADKLKIGESIWGSNKKIIKITPILDIPLTPCVVEGEIFVNEFLISCWSQSKENAEKMMQLMKIVEKFMGDMNEKELELLSHSFYEKFKASGKNMDVLVN